MVEQKRKEGEKGTTGCLYKIGRDKESRNGKRDDVNRVVM